MVGETLTLDNRAEDERVQQKEQLAGTVDSSEDAPDDDLNFDFFNVGNEGLLNLGLGINIDPNKIFSAEGVKREARIMSNQRKSKLTQIIVQQRKIFRSLKV